MMILADKIISLRKKSGWSQEELAQQLNVTRQSVSKWEGAQSTPDLDKVVQMSRLFGVSTDYLLKDELEEQETAPVGAVEPELRRVSMEEAAQYLTLRREAAQKMALATFLCVLSPITLILMAGLSELTGFGLSENAAVGIGLCVLLVLVAAAVAIFITSGAKSREFQFLEEESFETAYGVSSMVKERQRAFAPTATRLNTIGTVLCILSVVPLFLSICFSAADIVYIGAVCILLFLVALACLAFVYCGTISGAMEKLLEEGDYSRTRKASNRVFHAVTVCYWLVATAVFFLYTFGPSGNGKPEHSWFIWAIAGVLYGALAAVLRVVARGKDR